MAIVDGQIRCPACGEAKPLVDFAPSSVKRGNGVCKACDRARSTRYREANREAFRATARRWYARNKATHAERTARYARANPGRHFMRCYGITQADYDRMLAAQGGGCALCGKAQSMEKLRLAIDHDHETGAVRGILCHHCNRAIGALGDDVAGVRRALLYLERADVVSAPRVRINLLPGARA